MASRTTSCGPPGHRGTHDREGRGRRPDAEAGDADATPPSRPEGHRAPRAHQRQRGREAVRARIHRRGRGRLAATGDDQPRVATARRALRRPGHAQLLPVPPAAVLDRSTWSAFDFALAACGRSVVARDGVSCGPSALSATSAPRDSRAMPIVEITLFGVRGPARQPLRTGCARWARTNIARGRRFVDSSTRLCRNGYYVLPNVS
jgi:hypothetical protein